MQIFQNAVVLMEFGDLAYVFEEAAANLAEVRVLLIKLLLQTFQELPLEPVNLFNVAKDGPKLFFSKHVCPLAALFDVTLRTTETYDWNKGRALTSNQNSTGGGEGNWYRWKTECRTKTKYKMRCIT